MKRDGTLWLTGFQNYLAKEKSRLTPYKVEFFFSQPWDHMLSRLPVM